MDCAKAQGFFGRYLRGELGAKTRKGIERHLSTCLPCTSAFKIAEIIHRAVSPCAAQGKRAPKALRDSIRVCVACMEDPGRAVCPRLRFKLRLVRQPADDV